MRFGQMQAWPVFRNLTRAAPLAAWTGSASSSTRKGAWPPNSSETRFICGAARAAIILPTPVEPVKVIFRTLGSVRNTSPTGAGSSAVTRLTTPAGTPAASRHSNTLTAESGVASAGFSTMVQPAAMAGATFRVTIETG